MASQPKCYSMTDIIEGMIRAELGLDSDLLNRFARADLNQGVRRAAERINKDILGPCVQAVAEPLFRHVLGSRDSQAIAQELADTLQRC